MDLILWRHAEAEPVGGDEPDLERPLTVRGERQAQRMATWIDKQLPQACRVLSSPAMRAEQTVLALGRKYKILDDLAPDCLPDRLLELVGWPDAKTSALIVGHQPVLGQVIARLLGMQAEQCAVKKGAIWWLRHRIRDDTAETTLIAVLAPESL